MSLTVGQPAPSFTLPSSDGGTFALDDLRGTNVVVYFYPRDNTPGCTIEAEDFRDAVPALKKLGAMVVGISKDSIASHCKFRDKFHLSFPLLSDADGHVLEAYGAWGDKMMYGKPMVGVIRSTAIIGADGKVLRHWPKVSVKGHAADVVAAVAELTGQKVPKMKAKAAPAPAKAKSAEKKKPVEKKKTGDRQPATGNRQPKNKSKAKAPAAKKRRA
jgi:peroxiredoxin Q/BCP